MVTGGKYTSSVKEMGLFALGLVTLGVICLMGIAVIQGFQNTNLVDNTTALAFRAGLAIFGTFATVIGVALVGKLVIGLFKGGM